MLARIDTTGTVRYGYSTRINTYVRRSHARRTAPSHPSPPAPLPPPARPSHQTAPVPLPLTYNFMAESSLLGPASTYGSVGAPVVYYKHVSVIQLLLQLPQTDRCTRERETEDDMAPALAPGEPPDNQPGARDKRSHQQSLVTPLPACPNTCTAS